MPTILDSNVVLDHIQPEQHWTGWSAKQLLSCANQGAIVVNAIVFAEISGHYMSHTEVVRTLAKFGVALEDLPWEAAYSAGQAHRAYRRAGGKQQRILADFLIGAHASMKGYSLLTRDQSRYRSYFPKLDIIAPDTHP